MFEAFGFNLNKNRHILDIITKRELFQNYSKWMKSEGKQKSAVSFWQKGRSISVHLLIFQLLFKKQKQSRQIAGKKPR